MLIFVIYIAIDKDVFTFLVKLIEHLKFKNVKYLRKRRVSDSSPNKNSLLYCNKVFNYKKKKKKLTKKMKQLNLNGLKSLESKLSLLFD